MAYGLKYRFRFDSAHGVQYLVKIMKDGYTGSVIDRPLGGVPVIHMKDGDPVRGTSCDLVLECQVDGEFAEFYTTDPMAYMVRIYRGGTLSSDGYIVWSGFLATEIYSEPNIAPPYNVSVTATDGLGTLKEYDFEAAGLQTIRTHLKTILNKTGEDRDINFATSLCPQGQNPIYFMDTVKIDIDFLAGKNCYEVLETILTSLHATITEYSAAWLVIRETDISVNSSGALSIYNTPGNTTNPTSSGTISNADKSVGKMGVADMWPIGYTMRRVVPAKRRVVVSAPWHISNAAWSVKDNEWLRNGDVFFVHGDNDNYYAFQSDGSAPYGGYIYSGLGINGFSSSMEITVRVAARPRGSKSTQVGVAARFSPTSGTTIYYANKNDGWVTAQPGDGDVTPNDVEVVTDMSADATDVKVNIPAPENGGLGMLTIYIYGRNLKVFDVDIRPTIAGGYKDTIIIDNGARGEAGDVEIIGGRIIDYASLVCIACYTGVFCDEYDDPILRFSDSGFSNKDFLSLQTLGRSLSVALPRVETSGKLDFPEGMTRPPVTIYSNGARSLVTSYDWDLKNDELSFKAITLPGATLTVTSETVTPMRANN